MIDKPGCMEALKEVERLLDGDWKLSFGSRRRST